MKLISLLTSLWYDPHWWEGRTLSWKKRKWYFARVPIKSVKNNVRVSAWQFGPFTLKLELEVWNG